MSLTIQEKAMQALVTLFKNVQAGLPSDDPYEHQWNAVIRDSLGEGDVSRAPILAVLDLSETDTVISLAHTDPVISVQLQFTVLRAKGVEAYTFLNQILGEMKRQILADYTLGGFAKTVKVVGSEKEVGDAKDIQLGGSLFIDVHVRHATYDPRRDI